jgi:hypothetical protein
MSVVLAALLFTSMQAQPTIPGSAIQQEIVVLGGKLKRWTASYEVRGTATKCATKKSSGDLEVDKIGCASFEACLPALQPRIDTSDKPDLDKKARRAIKVSIKRDLAACVTNRRDEAIAELAERRWQARQGSTNAQN